MKTVRRPCLDVPCGKGNLIKKSATSTKTENNQSQSLQLKNLLLPSKLKIISPNMCKRFCFT